MAYITYKGSPDVFDELTGRYIPGTEAATIPNFFSQVKQAPTTRPDVKIETDFARLAGKNIMMPAMVPQQTQPTTPQQTTPKPTQPSPQGQPQDATLTGQQDGGKFNDRNFGRVGEDVYEIMPDGQRRPITGQEFTQKLQPLGLNLDVLPQIGEQDDIELQAEEEASLLGEDPNELLANFASTYGIDVSGFSFDSDPSTSLKNIVTQVMDSIGLPDVKSNLESITGEIEDLQLELSDKILEINDNPWLSENARAAEVRKISDRYEEKINIRTNRLQLMQDVYDDARQEAQFAANLATNIYQNQQDSLRQNLQFIIERAENLADTKRKATERAEDLGFEREKLNLTKDQQEFENQLELAKLKLDQFKASKDGGSGLTPAQINSTVGSIAQAFDNEPIVKNYNTIAESVDFIKSAGVTPTDDIARIYAFAKVMDPNSAVKEGEYDSIQEYSTALLERTGLKAKRVFSNEGFLTDEARKFINTTLQARLKSSETAYKNVYSQYQKRIDTAQSGGMNSLTDYSKAFGGNGDINAQIEDDIKTVGSQFGNREQLIDELVKAYPELGLNEIASKVYTLIPDKK